MKPGDVFHRFELRQRLGEGGMGRVFLAWDREQEREVALKLVALEGDPQVLENEKRGAVLQERLAEVAPEVARVFEYGEAEGHFFVAMEYVDGQDLVRELNAGALPLDRALAIARQLASFLCVAHDSHGELDGVAYSAVVHGDLKPENIRLQEGDRLRLFDFGSAHVLSREQPRIPLLFGTYPYTAPERLVDDGLADARADLWAVGVILYQMVAGRPPYQAASEDELKEKILGQTPDRLPDDCPKPLRKIIQLCLAQNPERRYPSAADLCTDLEAFTGGRMVIADKLEPTSAKTQRTSRRPRGETGIFMPPPPAGAYGEAVAAYPGTGLVHPPPLPPEARAQGPALPAWLAELQERTRGWSKRHWLAAFLVAVVALMILSTALTARQSRGLVDDLQESGDLDAAVARYHTLRGWSFLGMGLGSARSTLADALETEVDRIFASYRQGDAGTTQGDWQRADRYLDALAEVSSQRRVGARRPYCDGHLERLRAAGLRTDDREAARSVLSDAIYNFERAAKIDEEWADPHLGLARIYAYDAPDLAKLQTALDAARERGYRWSRRESAQLADGFRAEGEALWGRSKKFRDDSMEKEEALLQEARTHLLRAIELYDDIIDYARAGVNKKSTIAVLRQVESRLVALAAVHAAQDDDEGFLF